MPEDFEVIFEGELPDHLVEELSQVDSPEPTTHVSILLGAGFSVPASYPTASQLNSRLKQILADEILIHSSGTALFLRGQVDTNAMLSRRKRTFVEKFLEFYNSKIESVNQTFHYEDFFDYYIDLLRGVNSDVDYTSFCSTFKNEFGEESDDRQLLNEFNQTFQQLISGELYKKVEGVHHIGGYPGYGKYLQALQLIGENNITHIHTLNHDLHMEQLEHTDQLAFKFSDGFIELGSPYYVRHKGYKIRTRFFDDKYDTRFRLYKLHGSVDNIIYIFNQEKKAIKHIFGTNYTEYLREYRDISGTLKYHDFPWNWFPDFLSGTTVKTQRYGDPYYYEKVFNHFRANLQCSKLLIVIGYGFGDAEINRLISEEFISREDVKMVVIDPFRPSHVLLDNSKTHFLQASVSSFDLSEFQSIAGL